MERVEVTHPSEWCKLREKWVSLWGATVTIHKFTEQPQGSGHIIHVIGTDDGEPWPMTFADVEFLRMFYPVEPHKWWAKEFMRLFPDGHKQALRETLGP